MKERFYWRELKYKVSGGEMTVVLSLTKLTFLWYTAPSIIHEQQGGDK